MTKLEHKITVRLIDFLLDYGDICNWWKEWNMPPIPVPFLPPTAFVAEYNGEKVAAAFLYKTDSLVCCLDWFITNPKAPKRAVIAGIDAVIEEGGAHAKSAGYHFMYNSVENRVVLNRLTKAGYELKEINRANVVRKL